MDNDTKEWLNKLEKKIDNNTFEVAKLIERCKWFMLIITALCATVYGLQFNLF